jgi:hypothetical protein
MATSLSSALVRVLALASGMAAGAVIAFALAVAVTPADTPKAPQLLLVLQGNPTMLPHPHSAATIRDRS